MVRHIKPTHIDFITVQRTYEKTKRRKRKRVKDFQIREIKRYVDFRL